MNTENQPPTIIAVMGTGRSGTSLFTKILDCLGVYLGPEELFMSPTVSNPKGYFELQPIFQLNNEVLDLLGGNWLHPPPMPPGWEKADILNPHREKLREFLNVVFGESKCWAWKDPRSCWTLPFWQQELPEVKALFALRNPIDVARSFEKAWNIPFGPCMSYWHRATTAALKCTTGMERLFLFYDDVIDDCLGALRRIACFIGRPELAEDPEIQTKVASFVEKKLHRNQTTCEEVLNHQELTFTAQSLYMALRGHVRPPSMGKDDTPTEAFMKSITLFADKSIVFQEKLDLLIDEYERLNALQASQPKPATQEARPAPQR